MRGNKNSHVVNRSDTNLCDLLKPSWNYETKRCTSLHFLFWNRARPVQNPASSTDLQRTVTILSSAWADNQYRSQCRAVRRESERNPELSSVFIVFILTPVLLENTMEEDLQEGLQAALGPPDVSDTPQENLCGNEEEEPKTRAKFLKYSCEITLDQDTANPRL